jgi:hypothetical protein
MKTLFDNFVARISTSINTHKDKAQMSELSFSEERKDFDGKKIMLFVRA